MITRRSLIQVASAVRKQSTAAAAVNTAVEVDPEWINAKPYSEIPGPRPLPFLGKFGNAWRLTPFGTYGGMSMLQMCTKMFEEYGPIVRVTGLGRPDMVMVSKPEDAEKVYRTEGPWPIRRALDSADYYRRHMRKDVFNGNPGLGTSQGEEWQTNRTAVNQPMMRPRNIAFYQTPIESATDDFIKRIRILRDDKLEMPADFSNELSKWALESVCIMALDTRLGCLDGELKPDSEAQTMINAVNTMFQMLYELDFRPSLYKYIPTWNWKKFVKAMDTMTDISLKHINRKKQEIESRGPNEEGKSILETLLKSPGGHEMAIIMAMDMMAAGIDTTSHTLANTLYLLAKNPEAQEKLFEETKKLLPTKEDSLPGNIDTMIPYTKVVIKESQRVSSITGSNARTTVRDIVLQGYRIPKGTDMLITNQVMSFKDEHFPRAKEFIPERWLVEKDSPLSAKHAHPFVVMPFGFGPRMCIGRRIAELELRMGLIKIIRNFKLSADFEMTWRQGVLITPDSPLKFKMEDHPN